MWLRPRQQTVFALPHQLLERCPRTNRAAQNYREAAAPVGAAALNTLSRGSNDSKSFPLDSRVAVLAGPFVQSLPFWEHQEAAEPSSEPGSDVSEDMVSQDQHQLLQPRRSLHIHSRTGLSSWSLLHQDACSATETCISYMRRARSFSGMPGG